MRTLQWILCGLVAWLAWAGPARADVTVEVRETSPSGDAVALGPDQTYYLRLEYSTDEAVHIWARPWFHGREVDAGSHPSPQYTGSGEALGWFFIRKPGTQVDEIRITAGDGTRNGTRLVAIHSVEITVGRTPVAATAPAWVARLRAQAEQAEERARQASANQPDTIGDKLFFAAIMLAVPLLCLLSFAMPAWALWRWRGGWRIAAAVPAAIMAFVVLRILVGVLVDPTSHNLWPFEIIMAGMLGLGMLLALWLVRRMTGAGAGR